ncbi:hypothetical protein KSC_051140 [Ktedonobacter sp. SOSP1-52]|uniref:ATP-binding protein n=1 Tax=Ktedonobacter sp. SOSP1-52 TaxID=2778366 RepID=UPI001915B646|nr:ATP-binding protein [Ktedonobacter sp. SOSP1-52]GHO66222.1 hypothetical protein KSC_051140 [Ktedonobacter sp. SOSP1-52]
MTETYASLDLSPWRPTPTTISSEWRDFITLVVHEAEGQPKPPYAYVFNVRYDAWSVGDQLRDWGLPEPVVIAGYLRSYDETLLSHVTLPGAEKVRAHFKSSLHYTRYIEEEQLANLLIPPYPDLGALLIALAVHYQALCELKEHTTHQPLAGKLLDDVQSAKRTLIHITKRLGLWDFKRHIEDIAEELIHPKTFLEDKQRYEKIFARDMDKIESLRSIFEQFCQEVTDRPVHVVWMPCGVAGLKRRSQDTHTTATSQKERLYGFDLVNFDVITPVIYDCYLAMGALFQLGTLQDRVTDQIAHPKPNGYCHLSFGLSLNPSTQSLRKLSWLAPDGEVTYNCFFQIGTKVTQAGIYYGCLNEKIYALYDEAQAAIRNAVPSMHDMDPRSIWFSEEGNMYAAIKDGMEKAEMLDEYDVASNPIIVYDKSHNHRPIRLPKGATVLDFAYKLDPDIGSRAVEGFINNRKSQLFHELNAGDIVEVRTARETQVKDYWLDDKYATSDQAQAHIESLLKQELHNFRSYELIREALEFYHYPLTLEELDEELRLLVTRQKLGTRQAYLEQLNSDGKDPHTPKWAAQQIIQRRAEHNEIHTLEVAKETADLIPQALLGDSYSHPPRLCGSCQPMSSEQTIVAYKGKNSRELVAHTLSCLHITRLNDEQRAHLIPLQWQYRPPAFKVAFFVVAEDRRGLVLDIAKKLRRRHCSLLSINADAILKFKKAEARFVTELYEYREVAEIINDLKSINGVTSVEVDAARTVPYIYQRIREHQQEKPVQPQEEHWHDVLSSLGPRSTTLRNAYDISRPASSKMFFGRESELRYLARELCEGSEGKAVVLYAPRRSGKSSLCKNFLRRHITSPAWGVFYSLQGATRFNEERVLRDMAGEISASFQEHFDRPAPQWDTLGLSDVHTCFRRFIQRCLERAPGSRLVLILDEFGGALQAYENGVLELRFFTYWRELLSDISQTSLLLALPTSSHKLLASEKFVNAFSFAQNLPMPFLDQASAERLLTEPLRELRVLISSRTVHQAVQLTGGNPYYMALIGMQFVRLLNDHAQKQQVTDEDLQLAVDHIIEAGGEQSFSYYRQELHGELEPRILDEMLEIMAYSKHTMISLRQLTKNLGMAEREIRPALERMRNSLILDEHAGGRNTSNPEYTFKIELVRLWLMRNRWLLQS